MKIILIAVLFLSSFVSANAQAAPTSNDAQFGIILGSVNGLSGKFSLGNDRAIDGALAYSSDTKYGTYFHADYLFNKARQFAVSGLNPVHLYYGLGGRFMNIRSGTDDGKTKIGVRAPIGVYTQTSNPDLELFAEIAPLIDITPSSEILINVEIGVRLRF